MKSLLSYGPVSQLILAPQSFGLTQTVTNSLNRWKVNMRTENRAYAIESTRNDVARYRLCGLVVGVPGYRKRCIVFSVRYELTIYIYMCVCVCVCVTEQRL
jgi:hypothetical protein